MNQPLHFIRQGQVVTLGNVPPTRTLLQVLREDLGSCGTKEGCASGDCGACTVVEAEPTPDGKDLKFKNVNACIRLAHSFHGKAIWTVEDLARPQADGSPGLHPCQQAMVEGFGSQCGFCTPGFVMSLFATYQNRVARGEVVTREAAQADLSGNLCRCTGYRPILDAAQAMGRLPAAPGAAQNLIDKAQVLLQIRELAVVDQSGQNPNSSYHSPKDLEQLLRQRARQPAAQLVAGCTDVGLWINKLHLDFPRILDVTQVKELRRVERYPHHIAIGAAVTLHDAFAELVKDRPQLKHFAGRFAGQTVRHSGTLGGNVANGSPIGDSMPLLIALGSSVVLMRWDAKAHGGRGLARHRELRLEDFYTGYRKNVLQPDEVLAWIKVPLPQPGEFLRAYKLSKRFEDDISAVCLVLNAKLDGQQVKGISIGVGGVAATPVRAIKTEAACGHSAWSDATIDRMKSSLMTEFQPITDMRASDGYRRQALGALLQRFWLESQGEASINLEAADWEADHV
jgi:xanthine dehydrogenase small subunit